MLICFQYCLRYSYQIIDHENGISRSGCDGWLYGGEPS